MTADSHPSPQAIRSSRIKLVLLFTLFVGPLVASFIWYYGFGAAFAPSGESNHSPLVSPAVPLEAFDNPLAAGGTFSRDDLERQWTLVHVLGENCPETCETFLYHTRQTRLGVGKDIHRLARVLLVPGADSHTALLEQHPDATVIVASGSGLGQQLARIAADNQAVPGAAFMVDPIGNVMMWISPDVEPKLLLKDLKKLLKISRIG